HARLPVARLPTPTRLPAGTSAAVPAVSPGVAHPPPPPDRPRACVSRLAGPAPAVPHAHVPLVRSRLAWPGPPGQPACARPAPAARLPPPAAAEPTGVLLANAQSPLGG